MGDEADHPATALSDEVRVRLYDQALNGARIGAWECELETERLTWTAGVYDIFGVPRDAWPVRDDIVALYSNESREIMERLRAYAIKHRRGFTIDLEIRPSLARSAWMRLSAAPICKGNKVVRLQGVKRLIL